MRSSLDDLLTAGVENLQRTNLAETCTVEVKRPA
jgi:hypothetical protein